MRVGWAVLAAAAALMAHADSVVFDGYTTMQATPLSCREASFGPDVGGFDPHPDPEPDARYTFMLLTVEVTGSETRTLDGKPVATPPPHLRIANGHATFLLQGRARDYCPQLRKPTIQLLLLQKTCGDMLPYRGMCVAPLRFVRVVEPSWH